MPLCSTSSTLRAFGDDQRVTSKRLTDDGRGPRQDLTSGPALPPLVASERVFGTVFEGPKEFGVPPRRRYLSGSVPVAIGGVDMCTKRDAKRSLDVLIIREVRNDSHESGTQSVALVRKKS